MSAQTTARRSSWADLPAPLWELIAGLLPTPDVLALRQGWRGAAHLAELRVRAACGERLSLEVGGCVAAIRRVTAVAARDGVAATLEMAGVEEDHDAIFLLTSWLKGALQAALGNQRAVRCLPDQPLRDGCVGVCSTVQLQPRGAGIAMQAVFWAAEPDYGWSGEPPELELEELRFLAPDGALLAEYSLASWQDPSWCSVRSVRLAATGYGRLQLQPMREAVAHFEALAAAALLQPLRAADGRWSSGLLLAAIWVGVTTIFKPQLS